MKITLTHPRILSILFWTLLLSGFTACSNKVGFQPSTVAPAARGDVKVGKDNNGNYAISLEIKMLAEPNRLSPPKAVYLVWMDTEQNGTQPLGQLKSEDGLFSSTLKASLKTTSPYKPRRIFVTAEDAATMPAPGSYVVLSTNS